MIAQVFGFTRGFVKERNNRAYFRLNKISCGFKEQARARQSGEKSGLEVDFIKIDGGFVRSMLEDPMNNAIVEAINTIGHVAGIQTIADFVESGAVLERLGSIGVDFAQGWAVGYPQPFADL